MSETSEELSTTPTTSTPENEVPAVLEETTSEQPEQKLSKFDRNRFNEEQREERQKQVWRMWTVDRMTQKEICKALGISNFTINHDIRAAKKQRLLTLAELDKEFIVTQDTIYDGLLDKWLPIALREGDTSEESFSATDKVTTILGQQAKLHGFGAAGKVSPKESGKEIGKAVLDYMKDLAHGKIIEAEVIQPKLEDAKT